MIGCVQPQPIGDDVSLGEVESGKHGIPPGSLLYYSGRGGEVEDIPVSLSHIQYDLPSWFTHPQELARNTVKMFKLVLFRLQVRQKAEIG